MTRWTTLCIVACWLIATSVIDLQAATAAHGASTADPRACLGCHPAAAAVLKGPMAMRSGERAFAHRAFGAREGDRFFAQSCSGCHVAACADCHGRGAHFVARPANDACLRCHRGYSAGWEYEGKAPREDHARYQRGAKSQGEPFLKMLPDVHFERGMTCADCHPMSSMHIGGKAKTCADCHPSPTNTSPEHAIDTHLETMTCVACHAAWASQEYGTFLIRTANDEQAAAFEDLRRQGPWRKSAHLKRQDAPPLGLDARSRVAPIRPRFVLFITDPDRDWENRLVAAEWRAFTPHTVRRGTVTCTACHDSPRRFVLEPADERIYLLDRDGLPFRSWWDRAGQTVVNGSFMPVARHERMNAKTPEYNRGVVSQWKQTLSHAAPQ